MSTFKIIKRKDLPKDSNLIDTGFIHKLKTTSDGNKDFVKSRLVGRGYGQKFGVDCFESYAKLRFCSPTLSIKVKSCTLGRPLVSE